MARFLGRDEKESLGMELAELGRSIGSPFHHHTSSFRSRTSDARSYKEKDDEVDLQWAAIERLPTFERVRTSLFGHHGLNDGKEELGKRVIHVTKLGALECNVFINKLLKKIEENNHQLLQKLREGMDRQAAPLFLLEVRYQNLSIEAECEVVHGEPLPTLWNTLKSTFHVGFFLYPSSILSLLQFPWKDDSQMVNKISNSEQAIKNFTRCKSQANMIKILKDVSGIIKPSRMTLLLGPPGCGKTTLLLALAGRLNQPLKVTGEITYKGCNLDKALEAEQAISVNGLERSLQTDYILKILGLDICADTIVGDNAMRRGISGGQRKG
ncbi:Pleiotropic drug resistance protein 3 [Vitis vinifera]|uniref:Pleiotropic drug resistance protein 3 n=1 Tax=Vitis vinifera TaxID=29760 RepID=A0A438E1N2_VITVI|nr:Pleiotropic drug resistance protein 3 [Vitis vinifera]